MTLEEKRNATLLLMLLIMLLPCSLADFSDITPRTLEYQQIVVDRAVAMYAPEDFFGKPESYVKINLLASSLSGNPVTGKLEVILLQATDLSDIGYYDKNGQLVSYCCTADLKQQGVSGCVEVDEVIISTRTSNDRFTKTIDFQQSSEAKLQDRQGRFDVHTTGEHILLFANCDPQLGAMQISGSTEWRNPFGWLAGRFYGFLSFYLWISVFYIVFGMIWLYICYVHLDKCQSVHEKITVVIALCIIEVFVHYAEWSSFNTNGHRNGILVIASVLLSVLRLTASRVLVLMVSMGYGLVKSHIGDNAELNVFYLSIIYIIIESGYDIAARAEQSNIGAKEFQKLFFVPVFVCDAFWYYWIITSLYKILQQLDSRKQRDKLDLYWRFTSILLCSLVAAAFFTVYKMWYWATGAFSMHWSQLWLLDGGFSLIIYTAALVAVAVLFNPGRNPARFKYEELAFDADSNLLGANSTKQCATTENAVNDPDIEQELADELREEIAAAKRD